MSLGVRRPYSPPVELRDADAAYRQAIEDAIAAYTSQGLEPTEHLLALRAEIIAAEPLENKRADTDLLETAVPAPSQPARRRVKQHDDATS